MDIILHKATIAEAPLIHRMQVESFMPLLHKYEDYENSPANEPIERVISRINQTFTDYYLIRFKEVNVGAIRIVKLGQGKYRVSPLFILPQYQNKGISQHVFKLIEQLYFDAVVWELDTILEETGNCYLYEKVGYKRTGKSKVINEKLTIIYYEKLV